MLTTVYRTDSFDAWRIKTNTIATDLGDIATISVDIVNKDTVVEALNDLISYIGNAALTTTSQNLRGAVNEIKGSSLTFGGTKTFSGAVVAQSTLGVTGASTFTSGVFSTTLGVTGNFAVNTNKFTVAATTGNTLVAGTLNVTGASTLAALGATTGTFSSTLGVTGNTTLSTVTISGLATTAAITSSGTVTAAGLSISGSSTLAGLSATTGSFSSTLSATGNFAVNTNKFTVAATTGNTLVAGTFNVTGASTLADLNAVNGAFSGTLSSIGNFSINTNRFTVAGSTGNTIIAGTLGVTGAGSFSSGSFSSTFGVTGTATFGGNTIINSALNDGSFVWRLTNSHAAFVAAPNRITVDTAGNMVINGNLSVAGTASISGGTTTSVDWGSITSKPSPVIVTTLTGSVTGSGSTTLTSLNAGMYTITFDTVIADSSVTLGTHTVGNYVATAAAGTGISLAGSGSGPYHGALTITNSDRGSSQSIFKNIAVSGQTTVTASTNSDTLTLVGGSNVTLTTNAGTKTVTISASSTVPNNPTITFAASTGLTGGGSITLNQSGASTITYTNSDRGSSQNIFKTIASAGSTSLQAASNTDTLTLVAGQVSSTQGIAIALSSGQNVTISHFDTSSIANSSNSGGTVIQSMTYDTYGHALTVSTTNLDSRYLQSYSETSTLQNVTTRGATTTDAITVGGLTVSGSGSASIGGNLTVTGNLTVNGTTTTVASSTITVQDPIITLGGATPPVSSDGKDRGVEYRYFSGTAKIGWFGRRNTNNRFAFIADATNTAEVFSGTLGDVEATTFFGALNGNATTATTLQTARTINGVSFNGSANITVTASTTNTLTIGTGLLGTSFNGSAAVTISLAGSGVGSGGTTSAAGTSIPVITYDTYGRITAISSVGTRTQNALSIGTGLSGGSFDGSSLVTISLTASGVGAGSTVGSAAATPVITYDTYGRITSVSTAPTRTSSVLTIGTGLSGSSFDGSAAVTIALAASGVGAGSTVGSATAIPVITYDTYGRITGISSAAPNNGTLTLAVSGVGLSGSASFTANQSGGSTFTVASNATNANTASTIVARDASGNFSAGTITANLSGTATAAGSVTGVTLQAGLGSTSTPLFAGVVVGHVTNSTNTSVTITEGYGWRMSSPLSTHPVQFNQSILVGATASGSDYGAGNVYALGNVIAYYSDERLKTVIGPISGALSKVRTLNGFYYRGNDAAVAAGYSDQSVQVGVSAQAVANVLPEVVHTAPVSMDGKSDYKTVDYAKLTPLLIEAIKELASKVEELESRLQIEHGRLR